MSLKKNHRFVDLMDSITKYSKDSNGKWTKYMLVSAAIVLMAMITKFISTIIKDMTRRKRITKTTQIECAQFQTPTDETIFICLTSTGEVHVGDMIYEIFKQAYCPTRVYIGIVQHMHQTDKDVQTLAVDAVDRYKNIVQKDGTVPDFSNNIKKLNLPAVEARGRIPARHTCMKRLYNQEKFVLHVDIHCKMTKFWDVNLIDQWQRARQYTSHPIITCDPPSLSDIQAHIKSLYESSKRAQGLMLDQINAVKEFNIFDRLSEWNISRLRASSEFDIFEYPRSVPGTWQRMLHFNTLKIPIYQSLFFTSYHKKIKHPIPTYWYCSRLSFALASDVISMPSDPRFYYTRLSDGIDFIDGLRLWTSGCEFFNPCHVIAVDNWMHRQSGYTIENNYVVSAHEFWKDHRKTIQDLIDRYLEVRSSSFPSRNMTDQELEDLKSDSQHDIHHVTWIMHGEKRHIVDYMTESGLNWVDFTVSMQAAKGLYHIHQKIPLETIVFIKYGSWKEYRRRRHIKHIIDPKNQMPDDERWILEDHEIDQLQGQQHYFDLSSSFKEHIRFEEFYPHE